jgi:hypothetical protein
MAQTILARSLCTKPLNVARVQSQKRKFTLVMRKIKCAQVLTKATGVNRGKNWADA